MKKYDVIIIGGGAAGMMCAIRSKENNSKLRIAVLEKQNRIGRKLMSTGNGRCNLTNMNACADNYHGSFAAIAESVLEAYPPAKVIEEFNNMGLLIREEREGRVYPVSNNASSVIDVMRFRIEALGIDVICESEVLSVTPKKTGYEVSCRNNRYTAEKVVFATGSKASPKLGSDSTGLNILKNLGHSITELHPALCPINVKEKIASLKGIRVHGRVALYDGDKFIREECGEIQFAEKALSGICVFNLSSYLYKTSKPVIKISLLPDISDTLSLLKHQRERMSKLSAELLFTGILRKNLGIYVLKSSGIGSVSGKIKDISDDNLRRISKQLNNLRFLAEKTNDFSNAQVMTGGVSGDEVKPLTLESILHKNLFICGEALDIDGECGGYNLQFAFAGGMAIGDNL